MRLKGTPEARTLFDSWRVTSMHRSEKRVPETDILVSFLFGLLSFFRSLQARQLCTILPVNWRTIFTRRWVKSFSKSLAIMESPERISFSRWILPLWNLAHVATIWTTLVVLFSRHGCSTKTWKLTFRMIVLALGRDSSFPRISSGRFLPSDFFTAENCRAKKSSSRLEGWNAAGSAVRLFFQGS